MSIMKRWNKSCKGRMECNEKERGLDAQRVSRKRCRSTGLATVTRRPLFLAFLFSTADGEPSTPRRHYRVEYSSPSSCDDDYSLGGLFFSDNEGEERILSTLEGVAEDVPSSDEEEEWVTSEAAGEYTQDTEAWEGKEATSRKYRRRYSSQRPTASTEYQIEPNTRSPRRKESEKTIQKQQSDENRAQRQKAPHSNLEYLKLPDNYRVLEPQQPEESKPASQPAMPTSTTSMHTPWVCNFLASCHRDVLLPVPKDFCLDNFNLAQLAPVVERVAMNSMTASEYALASSNSQKSYPLYRQALRLMVQDDPVESVPEYLQKAARALYLLIHQRYVLSPRGLDMVRRRLLLKSPAVDPIFGRCPCLPCRGMPLLPYGDSENLSLSMHGGDNPADLMDSNVKRYCASCEQVFYHWDSKVDGCAFGPSFCHLFMMVFGKEVFGTLQKPQPSVKTYTRRIFGFRLHPSTRMGHTVQHAPSTWSL